jgi:hypothetical protein
MRNLRLLDIFRRTDRRTISWFGDTGDDTCGMFDVPSPIDKGPLTVIASVGDGWDHVSVSRPNRCPNWPEMDHIRHLFFREEECVMQLHPPVAENISIHPYCLHLWRPQDVEIPRPPSNLVGPTGFNTKELRHEPDHRDETGAQERA